MERQGTHNKGFTAIELLVVLGIIVLLLTVGLPAFTQMSRQADRTKARSILTSSLQRASLLASTSRTHTAVRFVPSAWEEADDDVDPIRGSQSVAIYQFRFSSVNAQQNNIEFNQRFELVSDQPPQVLPGGLWVAPAEGLQRGAADDSFFDGERVFDGNPGDFEVNADRVGEQHYDADDFLVVFDPENGVLTPRWPVSGGTPLRRTPWQISGYDPFSQARAPWQILNTGRVRSPANPVPYQRFSFAGLVLYEREVFLARTNDPESRQDYLQDEGEIYYVSRTGAGLIPASEAKQQ